MHPKPKKSLGQNFLVDKNIQEKIIAACNLKKTDTVVEIGPGKGEITKFLLATVKKVVAVEIDRALCERLVEQFRPYPNFTLLHADILKTSLAQYKNLKIIANIPYYISTPIITHLLQYRKQIKVIYLTMQKELAGRLVATAGTKAYGSFSCFTQFYTQPKILFPIKNTSFWPKPKVDSSFVELKILKTPRVKVKDEELFFRIIRRGFNQRRKVLTNSLATIAPIKKLQGALRGRNLSQTVRAEDLSLEDFARLAGCLSG